MNTYTFFEDSCNSLVEIVIGSIISTPCVHKTMLEIYLNFDLIYTIKST